MCRTLSILLLAALAAQAADVPFSSFPRTNVVHPEDWLIIQTTNYHSPSGQSTRLLKVSDFLSGLGVVSNAAIVNIINVFTTNNYFTTLSNKVALSVSNVATFGVGGSVIAGTNYYGGDGADLVLDPFAVRNSVDFLSGHQSRGPVFMSNSIWMGMIDMQYQHNSPGGATTELGVLADGDIHIKPALNSPNGYSIINMGGNARDGSVDFIQTANGNSQLLRLIALNTGAHTKDFGIIAHTNNDAVSVNGDFYNPVPTWNGSAWAGGNLQMRLGTNYVGIPIALYTTNLAWLQGLVLIGGSATLGTAAVIWNPGSGFLSIGDNNGIEVQVKHGPQNGGDPYWRAGTMNPTGYKFEVYNDMWLGGTLRSTNGYWYTNEAVPTAGEIGGTVGSKTNHMTKNVGGVLIDYWSDGATLYSKQLTP